MKILSRANKRLPLGISQATLAVIVVAMLVFGTQLVLWLPHKDTPGKQTAGELLTEAFHLSAQKAQLQNASVPQQLPPIDISLYKQVFILQEQEKWHQADSLLSQVKEPVLHGHVLAERYLHSPYKSTYAELASWIKHYSDLPQSRKIYELALRKHKPVNAGSLTIIKKKSRLQGYGGSHASLRYKRNTAAGKLWNAGITSWKNGNYSNAAHHFIRLAARPNLPEWDVAAAYYWAWRAKSKSAGKSHARKYLVKASHHKNSFYGMIAAQALGHTVATAHDPVVTGSGIKFLLETPAIHRSIALVETEQRHLAEQELRVAFAAAPPTLRKQLLFLTKQLRLPSLQIPMAQWLGKNNHAYGPDMYPVPRWIPIDGFTIDPALIYAIARQESGFNTNAKSSAGATGLMQLMPATANYVAGQIGYANISSDGASQLYDPSFNLSLGQQYIRYLMNKNYVQDNLVFLAIAYNAGPGNLIKLQKSSQYEDDPLMFIENIPFAETRHYVMQVLTNYWAYSAMLEHENNSLKSMATNSWPHYHAISDIAALN